MALPQINDTPKYDIVIPSSKLKTKFRPYLVKEEKILLLALEGGDETEMAQAVINIIGSCVDADVNEKTLKTYDMDYLFCQIRSKSVGESIDFSIRCEDATCGHNTEVKANLSNAKVENADKITNIIQLTETVSVEMEHLSYYDILRNNEINADDAESEIVFASVLKCIKTVMTENERIDVKEEPKEDLVNFVDSLTSNQYQKLKEFILTIPQVSLDVNWDCGGCGKSQSMKLKGLSDFFL